MPTYRYRCGRCGDELEVWQSITDDPLTEHEVCGGELRKVLSAAGIVLKGSGFYKTDSRSGNGSKHRGESKDGGKDSGSSEKKDSSSSDKSSGQSSGTKESSKGSDSKSGSSTGGSGSSSSSS